MVSIKDITLFLASMALMVEAADRKTTKMTEADKAYQIGLWMGIVTLVALGMAINLVGGIDYSNDILIISNTGEKEP